MARLRILRWPAWLLLGGVVGSWGAHQALAQQKPLPARVQTAAAAPDGAHDFDFEFGTWKMHLSRLVKPLTGSTTWTEYDGPSVVRKVWEGRANLGEIALDGPAGHVQGLSLRLYNPQSREWNISFSNSKDGALTPPVFGRFSGGRGEFFGQEVLDGRAIYVRFVFSEISPTSFRFEQAFSADGGKTWEVNWIALSTRA